MTVNGIPTKFHTYTFPETRMTLFQDNFSNTTPKTIKLIRQDGGFNEDRDMPAPSVIGKVDIGFYLDPDDPTDLDELRDAVSEMASWGIKKLWYRPSDGGTERYCWAISNNILMPQTVSDNSEYYQKVTLYFQVPFPRWIAKKYTGWEIGDGSLVGAVGLKVGSGGYAVNASGTSTNATLTYAGNAEGIVKIAIEPQTGQSCENVVIERYSGPLVVDRVAYRGVVGAGDILWVNGWTPKVSLNATPVWDSVTYLDPALVRVSKEVRTYKIKFKNAGDAARVTFYYNELYR